MHSLKIIRQARGDSLRQSADRLGVSHVWIADIEAGRRTPSVEFAQRVGKVYGASMEGILLKERAEWLRERASRLLQEAEDLEHLAAATPEGKDNG